MSARIGTSWNCIRLRYLTSVNSQEITTVPRSPERLSRIWVRYAVPGCKDTEKELNGCDGDARPNLYSSSEQSNRRAKVMPLIMIM